MRDRSYEGNRLRRIRVAEVTLAAALVLLTFGCSGPDPAVDREAAGDGPERDEYGSDPARGAEGAEGAPVCLQGGPFVSRGVVEVEASGRGGASRIRALRWHRYEGCERFVIDLEGADEEAGGRVGEVRAQVLRELGVVRIHLLDVASVDPSATDAPFDGPLARAAYAVIAEEGRSVYVDLHLGAAAEAAVATLHDPARVLVDLRPGGGPIPEPAPSTSRVVVLEPRPGRAAYPLAVSGYARTFEANVVIRLERNGAALHEDFTTATAWAEAWGHFTFTIPDGPEGPVILHVGEHSARDGSWEGVAVELRVP